MGSNDTLKLIILHQIKIQYQLDDLSNKLRKHFLRGVEDSSVIDCVIPHSEFPNWLEENYDLEKLDNDYIPLLRKFLKEYALDNTEKSEENL